jgi:hypothetical protein
MGDTTDAVKAGVEVIKLMANSAGSYIDTSKYVSALPEGVNGSSVSGWQFLKVGKPWKATSDWYEFWEVDWDFTVGMKWAYNGTQQGAGKFIDQATLTLDVGRCPPDFTLTVTQHFPKGALNVGGSGEAAIWALQSTITIEAKGFFGGSVAWTTNLDCLVRGDGAWQMAGG